MSTRKRRAQAAGSPEHPRDDGAREQARDAARDAALASIARQMVEGPRDGTALMRRYRQCPSVQQAGRALGSAVQAVLGAGRAPAGIGVGTRAVEPPPLALPPLW